MIKVLMAGPGTAVSRKPRMSAGLIALGGTVLAAGMALSGTARAPAAAPSGSFLAAAASPASHQTAGIIAPVRASGPDDIIW